MREVLRTLVCTVLLAVFPAALPAAVVNPHRGERCGSCHERAVEKKGPAVDYHFLAEEIDPTCLICHDKECCTIGKGHTTHISGIDTWRKAGISKPRTLPLHDEWITCVTCHFWRRELNPAPQDWKLVRMVRITPTKIDWTPLCLDCHEKV